MLNVITTVASQVRSEALMCPLVTSSTTRATARAMK